MIVERYPRGNAVRCLDRGEAEGTSQHILDQGLSDKVSRIICLMGRFFESNRVDHQLKLKDPRKLKC